MTSANFFPLTYSDHAADDENWRKAKELVGRRVVISYADGSKKRGRITRITSGAKGGSWDYGIGFMLTNESKHFPVDSYTGYDFIGIEALREADRIIV